MRGVNEHLWENSTKGCSSIPGSGIPSDWSNFDRFCQRSNTIDVDEKCDMAAVESLSRSAKSCKQHAQKLPPGESFSNKIRKA